MSIGPNIVHLTQGRRKIPGSETSFLNLIRKIGTSSIDSTLQNRFYVRTEKDSRLGMWFIIKIGMTDTVQEACYCKRGEVLGLTTLEQHAVRSGQVLSRECVQRLSP
jgi:hypothetical protein